MLIFKTGCRVAGLCLEIDQALDIATGIFEEFGKDCVVTSGRYDSDSHMEYSLHNSGRAVDLRRRHLTLQEVEIIRSKLTSQLGDDYKVLLESTHYHVHFRPKHVQDYA